MEGGVPAPWSWPSQRQGRPLGQALWCPSPPAGSCTRPKSWFMVSIRTGSPQQQGPFGRSVSLSIWMGAHRVPPATLTSSPSCLVSGQDSCSQVLGVPFRESGSECLGSPWAELEECSQPPQRAQEGQQPRRGPCEGKEQLRPGPGGPDTGLIPSLPHTHLQMCAVSPDP